MSKLLKLTMAGAAVLGLGTAGVAFAAQRQPVASHAAVDNQSDGETADDGKTPSSPTTQPDTETNDDGQAGR